MPGTLLTADRCKPGDTQIIPRAATYLVTIAGSAGGFRPLRELLAGLPSDFGAAVVAMLHSAPGSPLVEALRGRTRLPVCTVEPAQLLEPGNAYIAPPRTHVVVNPDARLSISDAPHRRVFRPSADWLFESAAASFGSRHVAVVLSGMLSDGATTLRAIKRCGGTVIVQAPEDADYPAMPMAAIRTGFVDTIAPTTGLAAAVWDVLSKRDARTDASLWEAPFEHPAS